MKLTKRSKLSLSICCEQNLVQLIQEMHVKQYLQLLYFCGCQQFTLMYVGEGGATEADALLPIS
jgi:hypothetical protein